MDASHQVAREAAEEMAKCIGAFGYFECSALHGQNLANTFDNAVRACFNKQKKALAGGKKSSIGWPWKLKEADRSIIPQVEEPPQLPKQDSAPRIDIANSNYSANFARLCPLPPPSSGASQSADVPPPHAITPLRLAVGSEVCQHDGPLVNGTHDVMVCVAFPNTNGRQVHKFMLHKMVLAASNEYFRKILRIEKTKEANILKCQMRQQQQHQQQQPQDGVQIGNGQVEEGQVSDAPGGISIGDIHPVASSSSSSQSPSVSALAAPLPHLSQLNLVGSDCTDWSSLNSASFPIMRACMKYSPATLKSGVEPGETGDHVNDDKPLIILMAHPTVSPLTFYYLIEFLYTGQCSVPHSLPSITPLRQLALAVEAEYLVQYLDNLLQPEMVELNPSITSYVSNEVLAPRMHQLFFNSHMDETITSDLKFIIADGDFTIPAHRAIVLARAPKMGELIQSAIDGCIHIRDIKSNVFLTLMNYLYTETASSGMNSMPDPIEDNMALLLLAHRFGQGRLVTLCELFLSKQVEKWTQDSIINSRFPLVQILNRCNSLPGSAPQLQAFLKHFLCANYQVCQKRDDWAQLEADDRQHMEAHQWPPISYMRQLEEYNRKKAAKEQSKNGPSSSSSSSSSSSPSNPLAPHASLKEDKECCIM